MEARVARLESDVEHIKTDIGDIKITLRELTGVANDLRVGFARIDERIIHLPTKAFIVKAVVISLTLVGALFIFQGNIQRFLGAPASTAALPTPITTPAQKSTR